MFINNCQDNWKEWLPIAEFVHNNIPHSAHQQSLFFLNYDHHPWTGKEILTDSRNKSAVAFVELMKSAQEDAQVALRQNAEKIKK